MSLNLQTFLILFFLNTHHFKPEEKIKSTIVCCPGFLQNATGLVYGNHKKCLLFARPLLLVHRCFIVNLGEKCFVSPKILQKACVYHEFVTAIPNHLNHSQKDCTNYLKTQYQYPYDHNKEELKQYLSHSYFHFPLMN